MQINTTWIVLAIFALVGFIMFLTMVIFIVTIFRIALKRREYDLKRGTQMQQVCEKMGWRFTPQAELTAIPTLAHFEMFEGSVIKLENLMQGVNNGKRVAIFDAVYLNVSSPGKGSTSSRQTMVFIEMEGINLPMFYLRPEKTLEKALNFITRVDIDFAHRPQFSEKYLLYGNPELQEETQIRHLFGKARLLDYYEQAQPFCTLGFQKSLFVYQSRTLTPPPQITTWVNVISNLAYLFGG